MMPSPIATAPTDQELQDLMDTVLLRLNTTWRFNPGELQSYQLGSFGKWLMALYDVIGSINQTLRADRHPTVLETLLPEERTQYKACLESLQRAMSDNVDERIRASDEIIEYWSELETNRERYPHLTTAQTPLLKSLSLLTLITACVACAIAAIAIPVAAGAVMSPIVPIMLCVAFAACLTNVIVDTVIAFKTHNNRPSIHRPDTEENSGIFRREAPCLAASIGLFKPHPPGVTPIPTLTIVQREEPVTEASHPRP